MEESKGSSFLFRRFIIISDAQGLEIVRRVASQNPELLQRNLGSTCYRHTQLVLAELNKIDSGWGHVGKTSGEGQYRPPTWVPVPVKSWDNNTYTVTGFSHDAVFNQVAFKQVDTLGGANDSEVPIGTVASPTWNVIPPQFYRPNNPWMSVDGSVEPAPCPELKVPGYEEIGGDVFFRANIGVPLQADMALAGQVLNDGSSVWFSRSCYDVLAAKIKDPNADVAPILKKHRNDWRRILGLPQLP